MAYSHNHSSILGGAGNDFISLSSNENSTYSAATVNGGSGDDTISWNSLASHFYEYADGDGNDIIFGFNTNDTLYITSGSIDHAAKVGNSVVMTIGSGLLTLDGAAGNTLHYQIGNGALQSTIINNLDVAGTSNSDNLYNRYAGSKVEALEGNDTIENIGDSVEVYGGTGNDSIYNSANYSMLDGGAGNDTI